MPATRYAAPEFQFPMLCNEEFSRDRNAIALDALSHWRAARTLVQQCDISGFRQRMGQSADLSGTGGKLGCLGGIDDAVYIDPHRLPIDQMAGLAGTVIPVTGDHLVSPVGMVDRKSGTVRCRIAPG